MDIFAERLFYPNYEIPFLSYFKDSYDSVFVAFLPFFKLNDYQIENQSLQKSHQISYEQLKEENKEFAKIPEFNAEIFSYKNENYPVDKTIIEKGEIVSWREIKEKALLGDFSEINKALKTSIGGYRQVFKTPHLLERLNAATEKEHIFYPTEGKFEPLVKLQIYTSLKYLNKKEILVIDEYLENEKELDLNSISLEDFIEKVEIKDYYNIRKIKAYFFRLIGIASFL